ncbi:hypothetical protein BC826DRAFT_1111098 [Russula brevipes]|nr:hypothetical protein BC826DRAFT_1111098 [Russula brevipes]
MSGGGGGGDGDDFGAWATNAPPPLRPPEKNDDNPMPSVPPPIRPLDRAEHLFRNFFPSSDADPPLTLDSDAELESLEMPAVTASGALKEDSTADEDPFNVEM